MIEHIRMSSSIFSWHLSNRLLFFSVLKNHMRYIHSAINKNFTRNNNFFIKTIFLSFPHSRLSYKIGHFFNYSVIYICIHTILTSFYNFFKKGILHLNYFNEIHKVGVTLRRKLVHKFRLCAQAIRVTKRMARVCYNTTTFTFVISSWL